MNTGLKTAFVVKNITLVFLTVCLLLPPDVSSTTSVYKWVDEKGKLHYSSTPPPGSKPAEKMRIKVKEPVVRESKEDAAKADDKKKIDKDKNKEEDEPLYSDKEKRALCARARDELATLQASGRIREKDKNGQSYYLTEVQRLMRIDAAKKDVKDFCN